MGQRLAEEPARPGVDPEADRFRHSPPTRPDRFRQRRAPKPLRARDPGQRSENVGNCRSCPPAFPPRVKYKRGVPAEGLWIWLNALDCPLSDAPFAREHYAWYRACRRPNVDWLRGLAADVS